MSRKEYSKDYYDRQFSKSYAKRVRRVVCTPHYVQSQPVGSQWIEVVNDAFKDRRVYVGVTKV